MSGPVDYFITGTAQELDGFRDHSWGESARGSIDVGYRLSEDAETRVYINANWVRQRIPGEVTKLSALTSPQTADPLHVTNDWQRNIDTLRMADKTAVRLAPGTLLEVGAFNVDRHLMHPIFLWLDYTYDDYGGFARLSDVHLVDGHKNRLIAGVNLLNGNIDAKMFGIGPDAAKLEPALQARSDGAQFLVLRREFVRPRAGLRARRRDELSARGARAGRRVLAHRRPGRRPDVRPVEPKARTVVGRRSRLAGVRKRLEERGDPELRREPDRQPDSDRPKRRRP